MRLGALVRLALLATASAHSHYGESLAWYQKEIDFLALLKARLTGSPEHNILIDHIDSELKSIGLPVYVDTINFSYNDPQIVKPLFKMQGQDITLSSYVPYSGTNSTHAVGKLVDVLTDSLTAKPDWEAARGNIAVTNITNFELDLNTNLWPGFPPFAPAVGIPAATAGALIPNLSAPAAAGVKAVVYLWDNITTPLADGQYVPFTIPDQPIPAVFVQSNSSTSAVLEAASRGASALLSLPQRRIPNTPTRTLWTMINGTDPALANETTIINTHTDGTNAVEENGHIALLTHARHLHAHPPRRTTILVFVTGHLHYGALAPSPTRATTLWLAAHPALWRGGPGERTAVFASCVEHLGAVHYAQDLRANTLARTAAPEPELLFAATAPLAALLRRAWRGADPRATRVLDPTRGAMPQSGEGLPLFAAGIPEVSLVTSPGYLLKVFGDGFDERALVDARAVGRQVASFGRVWAAVDAMRAGEIGEIATNGTFRPDGGAAGVGVKLH